MADMYVCAGCGWRGTVDELDELTYDGCPECGDNVELETKDE